MVEGKTCYKVSSLVRHLVVVIQAISHSTRFILHLVLCVSDGKIDT
jgi:hypothetical protein